MDWNLSILKTDWIPKKTFKTPPSENWIIQLNQFLLSYKKFLKKTPAPIFVWY
jgi:hypothetical protein